MTSKPTFILVIGAWHTADTWGKVVSGLATHGYKSTAVTLPTTLGSASASYTDDVAAVREAIVEETSQGGNVVVVVHSYGGAVGSSALKGLTKASSPDPGSGVVIGFFMIATGFMLTGAVFLDRVGGKPLPFWEEESDPGFALVRVPADDLFYHDLPKEEADYWVGRLQKHSTRAFTEGADISYAGWLEVPVWYLVTTGDKALPAEAQRAFIKEAIDAGGNVTIREIETSHSPMLSKPDETVGFILEATAAFLK
ncbi:unnamed protein product [Clonostachys rhizophaga]|uniref:AB hydrolase-1 domain-containing protein n=1 Tax=Clonostachys rhizophaga TaxID=160324 RepID=A0A9N9VVU0_9HYPO|nr:unnamed protein product [Clonostachys rhizophaga]